MPTSEQLIITPGHPEELRRATTAQPSVIGSLGSGGMSTETRSRRIRLIAGLVLLAMVLSPLAFLLA